MIHDFVDLKEGDWLMQNGKHYYDLYPVQTHQLTADK